MLDSVEQIPEPVQILVRNQTLFLCVTAPLPLPDLKGTVQMKMYGLVDHK